MFRFFAADNKRADRSADISLHEWMHTIFGQKINGRELGCRGPCVSRRIADRGGAPASNWGFGAGRVTVERVRPTGRFVRGA